MRDKDHNNNHNLIIVKKKYSLCADGKIRNRNFLTWQTILPSPLSL